MPKAMRVNQPRTPEARPLGVKALWLWALGNSLTGLAIGFAIHLFAGGDVTARGLMPTMSSVR